MDKNDIFEQVKAIYDEIKKMNIKYGMLSRLTSHIITDRKEMNQLMNSEYQLLTPEQVEKHKVAICWDMAELIRSRLNKARIPNYTIMIACMSNESLRLTHTTNLFKVDSQYYWIEGIDSHTLGVHKNPYKGFKEFSHALIKEYKEKTYDLYYTFLYPQPKFGITSKEYLNFVTNRTQIEKVKASSLHESTMYDGIEL